MCHQCAITTACCACCFWAFSSASFFSLSSCFWPEHACKDRQRQDPVPSVSQSRAFKSFRVLQNLSGTCATPVLSCRLLDTACTKDWLFPAEARIWASTARCSGVRSSAAGATGSRGKLEEALASIETPGESPGGSGGTPEDTPGDICGASGGAEVWTGAPCSACFFLNTAWRAGGSVAICASVSGASKALTTLPGTPGVPSGALYPFAGPIEGKFGGGAVFGCAPVPVVAGIAVLSAAPPALVPQSSWCLGMCRRRHHASQAHIYYLAPHLGCWMFLLQIQPAYLWFGTPLSSPNCVHIGNS